MLSLLAAGVSTPTLMIVRDGRSDFVIRLAGVQPALARGADEIQSFLKRATSVELPRVDRPDKRPAIEIRINQRLASEEYTINVDRRGVVIEGGTDRGALYGCYGFLQDYVGIRWFTSSITRVPSLRTLSVPLGVRREKAAFEYREPYFTEAFARDWAVRNRINGQAMQLTDAEGGKVTYGRFVHTFAEIVPPQTFFKDHPEYFSLVDGKRQSGYAQLCLTNPDVEKLAVQAVDRWVKDNPRATIFSVSQNDTYFNCQCADCKAIEVAESSPSGPLLRFVNRVADQVAKAHPNVLIDTLAYQWSEKPPAKEKPHRNVRVRLAPIGACFSHPMTGCNKNAASLANLNAWSKITKQLYIWHYCTDFANYLQPLPDLDEIAGDVKAFRDRGVVGLFYEGAYGPGGGGEMAELKSYLLARLMWNPSLDAKAIIDEFIDGVYDAAAPQIRAWLESTHAPARKSNAHATIYDPPTIGYLSDALLRDGEALFDEAERRVTNDPVALEQVQKARVALEYVVVMRTPASDPKRASRVAKLAADIRRFKIGHTSEGRSSEDFLKRIGAHTTTK